MMARRIEEVAQVPSDEAVLSELAGAREAAGLLLDDGPRPAALLALRERTVERIAREVGVVARLRALPSRAQLVIALALVGLAAVAVGACAPRAELDSDWHVPVAIAAALALAGGACMGEFLRPLHRSGDRSRTGALLVACAVGGSVAMVLSRASEPTLSAAFARDCGACLAFGCVAAAPLWLFALVARRHRARGWLAMTLVGAGAGILGQSVLELHCPIVSRGHHLLGHFGLVPVFVVGAFAVARRVFSTR